MKHLIDIKDLSVKEIDELINVAKDIMANKEKYAKKCEEKKLATLFYEPSTRTRLSFEIGMAKLGGKSYVIKQDEIILGKRESVEDTARVISKYADAVTIRTFAHSDVEQFAKFSSIPVVNALTDLSHPCQIMADLLTVYETFKTFKGLKLAYIGDGNNVTNSLLTGCASFGIDITAICPYGFEPKKEEILKAQKIAEKTGSKIEIVSNPYVGVKGANIVYTDVWASMGQENEIETRKEIFKNYQINNELMKNTANNSIVLHCLPAHKGQEIAEETFELHANSIFNQAENRMYAQMAILASIIK